MSDTQPKGAITMNNQLKIHYEISRVEEVRNEINDSLQSHYAIGTNDIQRTENGYKFMFDDETGGEIAITFDDHGDAFGVTVSGTWPWDVMEIYNNIIPDYAEVSHDPT